MFLVCVSVSAGTPGIAFHEPRPSEAAHHTTNFVFSRFATGVFFSET